MQSLVIRSFAQLHITSMLPRREPLRRTAQKTAKGIKTNKNEPSAATPAHNRHQARVMSNNLSTSSTTLHPATMNSIRFVHPDQFDDAPEEYQQSYNTHGVTVAINHPQTQVQQQVVAARRISDISPKFNQAARSMSPSASILPNSVMMTATVDTDPTSSTRQQRLMPIPPYSSLFRTTPTLEQFHLKSSATRRMLAATRPNVRFNSHQVDGCYNVSPAPLPIFVPQRISTNGNDPFFCPTTHKKNSDLLVNNTTTTTTTTSLRTIPHSVSPNHCHTPAGVQTPVISTYSTTTTTAAENRRLSQQEYLSASPDVAKSEDIAVKSQVSAASKRTYEQACLPYNSNTSYSVQSNNKAIIFTRPSKKSKNKKVVRQEKKYDKKWSEKYAELVAFHKDKGHCRVPQKYPNNPTLGIWVHNQRRKYKLGVMSFERVGLLNQIDFQWEITRGGERTDYPLSPMRQWESMFSELCAFKQKHGHFNVKLNTRLGDWVEEQRYWHDRLLAGDSSAKITKERAELLKCVGVSLTTN